MDQRTETMLRWDHESLVPRHGCISTSTRPLSPSAGPPTNYRTRSSGSQICPRAAAASTALHWRQAPGVWRRPSFQGPRQEGHVDFQDPERLETPDKTARESPAEKVFFFHLNEARVHGVRPGELAPPWELEAKAEPP